MVSTFTPHLASTIATVALCACATTISTAAWAQNTAPSPGFNSGKQVQKISKTDRKPQHVVKAARPETQSLRYLEAETP
jgi:hypothetical protein